MPFRSEQFGVQIQRGGRRRGRGNHTHKIERNPAFDALEAKAKQQKVGLWKEKKHHQN